MLTAQHGGAVRFSNSDSLEKYLAGPVKERTLVTRVCALQEAFFLGLRLNRGVELAELAQEFGDQVVGGYAEIIAELADSGLLEKAGRRICLTPRGRLLSNEIFERFISVDLAV